VRFPLRFCFFLSSLAWSAACFAQGGPPLVTDDPIPVEKGHWEINLPVMWTGSASEQFMQVPYVDANYGAVEDIQLKVETGWAFSFQGSAGSKSGAGELLAGVKWRLVDQDKGAWWSLGIYPQYGFHYFFTSADPRISQPGNYALLPIMASKEIGRWGINPEVGYLFETQGSNKWFAGLVASYSPKKDFDLLTEVHFTTGFDGEGTVAFLNLGTRYPFSEEVVLLFAIGRTFLEFHDDSYQALGYLGLQLKI
jgi:hypothetical protein